MDDDEKGGLISGLMSIALPAMVFVAAGGGIWYLLHDTGAARREAPPLPVMQAYLPPPPPPPKEKPPEQPKKVVEQQKQDLTPKDNNMPKPVTINGPAQAGSDAFNIGAGDGSGTVGGAFGAEGYSRYLSSVLQNAIEEDDALNHLAFNVQVAVVVDQNRHLHLKIVKSSGDAKLDRDIVNAADELPALDEAAPGPIEFQMAIHGKRPA